LSAEQLEADLEHINYKVQGEYTKSTCFFKLGKGKKEWHRKWWNPRRNENSIWG